MRKNRLIAPLLLFAVLISAPSFTLFAQIEKEPVIIDADVIIPYLVEKKVEARGNVAISFEDMKLTCDKAVYFQDSGDAYAEGRVVFTKGKDTFSGEKMRCNLQTNKGSLEEADFRVVPWYGKADDVEQAHKTKFIGKRSYITTCDLEKPHYRIQAKRVKIWLDDRVVAQHAVFYLGKVPLMYLPYYSHSLKDNRVRVTVIPGHTKEWGYYVLSAWRYYFSEGWRGWVNLDWRELKGQAAGVDHYYDIPKAGKGALKFYYIPERDKSLTPEEKLTLSGEKERYRFSLRHTKQLDPLTRLDLEFHKYKDEDVLKDYFYREYERKSQPASYLSIIRTLRRPAATLQFYLGKRVNQFYTEVEKLPSLTLDVIKQRLGESPFYYQGSAGFVNFNYKYANDSSPDKTTDRLDTYNQLSYLTRLPGKLSWINFEPYLGTRQTFYTQDANKDNEDFFRGAYYGGWDMTTRFYRIFNIETDFFGTPINKLKHALTPRIDYDYIHAPTVAADQLTTFDTVDSVSGSNAFTFSLENTLETRQGEASDLRVVDLMYMRNWVSFYPHLSGGQENFSNIFSELDLYPRSWLTISSDASFNHRRKVFDAVNVDLSLAPGDKWSFSLGNRYVRDSRCETTTGFNYNLNDKWKFRAYQRYEFEAGEWQEREYSVYRDLHCWLGELTFTKDSPASGNAVYLVFRLKAFPEIPFGLSKTFGRKRWSQK